MTPLRILIADDEAPARANLQALVRAGGDRVVAEAKNGREALELVRALRPDLLLLDVQMPGGSGFEVLQQLGADAMPAVLFTTAFPDHAVQAFEVDAIDYLVKPISEARFRRAIARVRESLAARQLRSLGGQLLGLLGEPAGVPSAAAAPSESRLLVREGGRTLVIDVDTIDWIQAEDYCATLHCGAKAHLVRQTLASLERSLDPHKFARVHRSAMVNLSRVAQLARGSPTDAVVLRDGTRIPLSRHRHDAIRKLLDGSR